MKAYGEIVGKHEHKADVRICKEKGDELFPTSLTLTAQDDLNASLGDLVELRFNRNLYVLISLIAYITPLLGAFIFYCAAKIFTDNPLIIDCITLLSLPSIYAIVHKCEKLKIFRNIKICTVKKILD